MQDATGRGQQLINEELLKGEQAPADRGERVRRGHLCDDRSMHCVRCGAVLLAPPPTVCDSCGTSAWNDAKPCACALVTNEDGHLLLIRRATEPWKGFWDIPGGFCNPGEHPIATAERETIEETGVQIKVTRFVGIWLTPYHDPKSDEPAKETMDIFYEATVVDDRRESPNPQEVKELRWFPADEIPSDMAFPEAQQPAIEAWLKARHEPLVLPDRPS